MIPITEYYDAYTPAGWVAPTVVRLVDSLPHENVRGLSSIVLTETAKIARVPIRRRGGRKFTPSQRLGFYLPAWRGERPSVYLVVDNMLQGEGGPWFQFSRDWTIAEVLFHEIGHHLNDTVGLIARTEESSADAWRRKLWRIHCRKRYWFLRPIFRLVFMVASPIARFARKRASAAS